MTNAQNHIFLSALQWHLAVGADEAFEDAPVDRTVLRNLSPATNHHPENTISSPSPQPSPRGERELEGVSELRTKAENIAAACSTLDELKAAIDAFDGIALKKTATQMVFSDGHPNAPVMVIGEAPGADEDRMGLPFVGVSGQLLDKILKSIDLDRRAEDPVKAVYISNILNWRPPGNRTPSPAEVEVSLPFIRRHIQLAAPKVIILSGAVSAKALLGSGDSISRLRGKFHDVMGIPAIATYHPSYLLRTPSQKRAVWGDMLMLKAKLRELGVI